MAKRTTRTLGIIALATSAALLFTACGAGGATNQSSDEKLGTAERPVKIGVVGAGEQYWTDYKAAAKAEGISVDIVDFSDYTRPNPAVKEGDLDLNQFQHIIYLADYNVKAGDDIQPIGATAIYPLGLYSKKYKKAADIKDDETVIVPNDDTNQARGLLLLQTEGLIKLKDGGSPFSTIQDVEKDKSRVKVTAVDAALTVGSLNDAAAAIVNNDFVEDAGLKASDAIAADDPNEKSAFPYINIFAAKKENANNKVLLKLVEIYQNDKKVLDGVVKASGGTAVLAKTPVADLVKSLDETEAQIKAKK